MAEQDTLPPQSPSSLPNQDAKLGTASAPIAPPAPRAVKRGFWRRYRGLWRDAFLRPEVGNTEQARFPLTANEAAAGTEHADVFMKAAGHHLSRVAALADTEWKVSLAFWATLVASGAALNTVAASERLPLVELVHRNSAVLLAGYLIACTVFLFGFSVNQSQSISTERNRFLYFQGAALVASGLRPSDVASDVKVKPNKSPLATVDRRQSRMSVVWGFKLLSSTGFALGAWGIASAIAATRTGSVGWPDWRSWSGLNAIAAGVMVVGWLKMTLLFFLRALRAKR